MFPYPMVMKMFRNINLRIINVLNKVTYGVTQAKGMPVL